ncbi:hypothetical protein ASG01_08330 [Chryseobacterium sp. Leaf180]|uniref:hypothetical protein n=1 Tax=Chryseobacterium sp. Leaf180 TaxID=1736289 RepID=UPI0006F4BBE3|nr:hypothetical protein [Chryseobacterium sp. Leaf180]KQR93856.1 hypothetical protein ASG01_08330 [Chryseobacterium sp. Leaf180]
MDKVKFISKGLNNEDIKAVKSTEDKYILLSLFVGQFRFLDNIQEVIDDLENVKNGIKTWEEIIAPLGNNWDIGYGNGSLDVENDIAYFLANDETNQSFKMPLQELIDLMKDWKIFMS